MTQVRPCRKCGSTERYASGACAPCKRESVRAWREANPERGRASHLARRYRITEEDYAALMAQQGGRCAICLKPPVGKSLAVDHDHATGYIRGLLDNFCNRHVVGRLRGEAGALILSRAADYLRNSPGRQVLPGHRVADRRPNGKRWADD